MRIETCFFCSSRVYPGHGTVFVRNDSSIMRFCRPKCQKAYNKKKNPRKVKWTKTYRKTAGKELAVDPSFEFEKQRHIPLQYSREKWQKTIAAMKRVEEIKQKRQNSHLMKRLRVGSEMELQRDKEYVRRDLSLIKSPAAGLSQRMEVEVIDEKPEVEIIDEFEDDYETESETESENDFETSKTITKTAAASCSAV